MSARVDEELVAEWLTSMGLRAQRFSKSEMRSSKTPEFRVFRGEELVFLCEVKSMAEDTRLRAALELLPPGHIAEASGPDPTYNAIENKRGCPVRS